MTWAAGGGSKAFRRFIEHMLANSAAYDFDADTIKAALYNDSITPNNDETTDVLISYNGTASQWVTANEVTSAGEWDAGGIVLGTKTINVATADVVFLDAADTASAAGATLTNAYGTLVYDDTLPTNKMGLCHNYFGGANSVTNGVFTIVWHANGILRFTL
jgi:hypothetical protein